jgi:nicotinate-nucleotide pyrophosphorylase (carboxylating)
MDYNKDRHLISIVRSSLKEDIGKKDTTTQLVIPKEKIIKAVILAKENCVVCGLGIARLVFKTKDKKIEFKPKVLDGQRVKKGKVLAQIQGKARAILTAERAALNFLCLLSGITTKTRAYINAIKPYKTKILDTRKTIPNLRKLQKYAVRTGGGYNHRMRLDGMVLVKDNHLKIIKGFKDLRFKGCKFELEVKNLPEFKDALKIKPDIIMLDNMRIKDIKKSVQIRNSLSFKTHHSAPKLEASGGITIKNIKKIAATGVDMISIGDLTHSVKSADISLEVL